MGIIGVVAALTIPNLNGSTNDMEKVAKVKKVYANLTEAYDRATAVYGPIETWFVNDANDRDVRGQRLFNRFTEFLKLSKGIETISSGDLKGKGFTLADGTFVSLNYFGYNDLCSSAPQYTLVGELRIDIDGKDKGKNKFGQDRFDFDITTGGIIPVSYAGCEGDVGEIVPGVGCGYSASERASKDVYGATLWVITHGNMDYLKIDEDDKCPNDKVLSWSNPSCK